MAHPNGGQGYKFNLKHSFPQAYTFVGTKGVEFHSTTGEHIYARQGATRDDATPAIVFMGERNRHGSACRSCMFILSCAQVEGTEKSGEVTSPHPARFGRARLRATRRSALAAVAQHLLCPAASAI
jgi:hypothetical protein